jgi:RNA polymerase sigma-70 factor, ECF subfamily
MRGDSDQRGIDEEADETFSRVYEELRRIAALHLRGERPGHTLQSTALVHEVWLRFAGGEGVPDLERSHFHRMAAMAMRRILINHARDKKRLKRGGAARRVALDISHLEDSPRNAVDLVALDEALDRLAEENPLQARLVELRYFAGLDNAAIAAALEISVSTVKREWVLARAWLRHLME